MRPATLLRAATVAAILLLVAAGALTVSSVRAQIATAGWVAHTHEVIAHLEAVLANLSAAESAQRAYLLTGDTTYLPEYRSGERQARDEAQQLDVLIADNPSQQRRLTGLLQALDTRFASMAEARDARADGELARVQQIVLSRSRQELQEVRLRLATLREEEDRLLERRLDAAEGAAARGTAAAVGTTALALALLFTLNWGSARHTHRLQREQEELRQSREALRVQADHLSQANEQLRQFAELLEQRVNERTAELAELNAQLQGFAHSVAHDLRAPLRNIQAFAQALLEDESGRMSPHGVQFAQRLADSSERLDGLVHDLLAYSRTARSHLHLQPEQPGTVLRAILDEMRPELERTGARVEVHEPLPAVLAHRTTLAQVLSNLLSNALKFVRPGQAPTVRIGSREHEGWVVLCVQDEGIGIDPEQHERIFAVFERLHSQEEYPGSGIGLAIVRKAVERMGGQVRVHSRPGAGSRFEVWLRPAAAEA
ncbi:ATP-binding protein [Ramlibacter sp. AN1015]|uniref:sensor histidine kinase n=1 Tax=Ramlibacter sp. AN1015 TaxID=3133428 RepID=UPI0030BC2A75